VIQTRDPTDSILTSWGLLPSLDPDLT